MLPSELIQYKKKSQKIIALTAWDSISGSIAEQANVDLVLVGDSLAMVCLGYKSTLPLTLENIIYHTNAVSRGFKKKIEDQPMIVSDMPFLTYQCGEDKAVEYAGQIIKNTYAKAVKIEGAEPEVQNVISRLIRMGIPVMGHLGLTPQSYLNLGLKKQGKNLETQEIIKREASILEKLGCFSIVLEHIPEFLAKEIKENLKIPVKNEGLFGIDKLNIKRSEIPAVTHVDNSARVQTVSKKINPKLKILLVTILTSISNTSIKKIGHTRSIKELVKKQVSMAKACGCHGIVCSGSDLVHVKKIFKGEIITPGIRLKGDSAGDQKRIMGPKEALEKGSTGLVLGRSIIKGNIKRNISRLIKELN